MNEYTLVITNTPNYPGIDLENTPKEYHYFLQKLSAIEVLYKKADNIHFPLEIIKKNETDKSDK